MQNFSEGGGIKGGNLGSGMPAGGMGGGMESGQQGGGMQVLHQFDLLQCSGMLVDSTHCRYTS